MCYEQLVNKETHELKYISSTQITEQLQSVIKIHFFQVLLHNVGLFSLNMSIRLWYVGVKAILMHTKTNIYVRDTVCYYLLY